MLAPAILYKDEIIKSMQKYFYTDDMMFETGCMDNWTPNIVECPENSQFQYAIVDNNEKLIGYLAYSVDWYVSKAYNFGLFSFDRGNPLVGRDVFNKLEELVNTLHRVEWRAVGGNPACRGYDNFIKRHNGNKYILKDSIKDRNGKYHDDIIYEIVKGNDDNMVSFTSGNADNITEAVHGLDIFTKNWCMNCEETEKQGDLIFRCNECEFAQTDGKCLVKMFSHEHKHNYPLSVFGSMGEH